MDVRLLRGEKDDASRLRKGECVEEEVLALAFAPAIVALSRRPKESKRNLDGDFSSNSLSNGGGEAGEAGMVVVRDGRRRVRRKDSRERKVGEMGDESSSAVARVRGRLIAAISNARKKVKGRGRKVRGRRGGGRRRRRVLHFGSGCFAYRELGSNASAKAPFFSFSLSHSLHSIPFPPFIPSIPYIPASSLPKNSSISLLHEAGSPTSNSTPRLQHPPQHV